VEEGDQIVPFTEIASGYTFQEAPRRQGDALWFCDTLAGGLYRLNKNGTTDGFLPGLTHIGGAAINDDGKVIYSCSKGIGWLDPASGRSGLIIDSIDGKPFSGGNDMIPDGRGGLYFGTVSSGAEGYDATATDTGLYRLASDGTVTLQQPGVSIANGVGLSLDGKRLYHTESLQGIFTYDVLPDGNLANRRLFSDRADGDGLAVDAEGCVWSASFNAGEIVRHRPDGSIERRIGVPHKAVTSLCFGGPDWRDLCVVTAGNDGVEIMMRGEIPPREASVFHAHSDVPGVPVPETRFQVG
jgi:sugar lactone lactonase YvrE